VLLYLQHLSDVAQYRPATHRLTEINGMESNESQYYPFKDAGVFSGKAISLC
jgi:hypothetical protein